MYDYLLKFIVIGETGCGKSCSILQLCDKRFESVHDLTIGVEFATTTLDVENKNIKVHIWDTAGQESFRSITRSYYRGSAGVILMYDITRRHTFTSLGQWLNDVRQMCNNNTSIILVGNKDDLEHRREVTFLEGQLFAERHGLLFCESSAKKSEGITGIFTQLIKHILQQLEQGHVKADEDCGIKSGANCKNNLQLQTDYAVAPGCCFCNT